MPTPASLPPQPSKLARLGLSLEGLLALSVLPLVFILGAHFFYFKTLEGLSTYWCFKARGSIDAPVKLIYVNVDSKAVQVMGERPFPRIFFAEAIQALFEYGKARTIGIDFVFSDSTESFLTDSQKVSLDNQAFRKALEAYPNVVLAAAYTPRFDFIREPNKLIEFPYLYKGFTDPSTNSLPELPSFHLVGTRFNNIGLINIDEAFGSGKNSQWVPAFARTLGPTYYTLALELARVYYNLPKQAIKISDDFIRLKDGLGKSVVKIPLTRKQLVEVNWFSSFYSDKNPSFSLADIIVAKNWIQKGTPAQKQKAEVFFKKFHNALILIGPTDPLLQDLMATPFDSSPVPKVGLHGNLIKTFFSGNYITHLPKWLNLSLVFCISVILGALCTVTSPYSNTLKIAALMGLGGFIVLSLLLFNLHHLVLPLAGVISCSILSTFVGVVLKLLHEEKQKRRIKSLFETYISPDLVQVIVNSKQEPQLGGIEQEITSFFSDVENFSSLSELLRPNQLVELMNDYLTGMTEVLRQAGGTLDKYIGDAIVAMFGAPVVLQDHALRACLASIDMHKHELELKKKWSREKPLWPSIILNIKTRIGLNTGLATIGNIGSKVRFNYTMMGDTVNLASRCETTARMYGVYTMVSEQTKSHAESFSPMVAFRLLDKIAVKGRQASVRAFEVVGLKNELSSQTQECIGVYEKALQKYWERKWDEAQMLFDLAATLEPLQPNSQLGIQTNPSVIFSKRCEWMKAHPPAPDWEGIFQMPVK